MNKEIQLKKNMSTFSLMMTGITSIIGSGWLLATQKISVVAGPVGILAWFVGMLVAILIAFFCIEIGTINPSAGGIGYYSGITHGRFSGFITQWVNWLSILAVPAVEAQAIVQYLSECSPMARQCYDIHEHILTPIGIIFAIGFMLLFMGVNYWGSKLFTRFNNALTIIKIVIPILTILFLIYSGLHPGNFGHSAAEFAPYGINAIGTAVISCGVIMSFNGFQLPLNFSEEIESPKRQLPIAIIGSILFTFVLYLALQAVFIGAIPPEVLKNGWHAVNYRSPYVNLLLAANFQVMAWSVMSTSAIAPAACGAAFVASGSRMIFALSRAKLLPEIFSKLDPKYYAPRPAILLNFILGSSFLFMFKGWTQLVAIISVLHVFSYLSMPVVVIAYRRQQSKLAVKKDSFRLPFAPFFALLVIFILALLLFFGSWPSIAYMSALVLPGLGFFFYYEYKNSGTKEMWSLVKHGSWLIYFMAGISFICFLGNNPGHNLISLSTSIILIAILSLSSFFYGVFSSFKTIPN
ncbi:MAG: amino acid:proton symporter [Burkholderiales bacterium]|jgi:amino acid transporter|nr:amino acid:proton symporter [Burkholderiales bacterium]